MKLNGIFLGAPEPLNEGLGSFVMSIASGGIDDEIDELEKEARDVKTPEQQIIVLSKVTRVIVKAIRIRHGKNAFRKFVHDNVKRVASALGEKDRKGDPLKEMDSRFQETFTRLARLRDKLLALKPDADEVLLDRLEKAKDAARAATDKAAGTGSKEDDY